MPADKAILAYRTWLQEVDNQGWRIDIETFNQRNGTDVAFAIPSPARKTSGNWVLDTLPLIESKIDRQLASVAAM